MTDYNFDLEHRFEDEFGEFVMPDDISDDDIEETKPNVIKAVKKTKRELTQAEIKNYLKGFEEIENFKWDQLKPKTFLRYFNKDGIFKYGGILSKVGTYKRHPKTGLKYFVLYVYTKKGRFQWMAPFANISKVYIRTKSTKQKTANKQKSVNKQETVTKILTKSIRVQAANDKKLQQQINHLQKELIRTQVIVDTLKNELKRLTAIIYQTIKKR